MIGGAHGGQRSAGRGERYVPAWWQRAEATPQSRTNEMGRGQDGHRRPTDERPAGEEQQVSAGCVR
ncbi:hypothetical protein ACZ91_28965 [Streptomyces regensis]|nr:hypothetical protein ACZ91_28965 [Streptomyces regensis]